MNDAGVRKRSMFFALQLLLKISMFAAKCGQMINIHIILLQCETRWSNSRSKSRNMPRVLPIIFRLADAKIMPAFNDDLFARLWLEGGMNDDGYQQQLEQLKIEHRDLDDAIAALTMQTVVDQLQIARLKKKKLILKDRIMRLEDQLVPDIIA
jgi:hypothetical protein